MQFSKIEKTNLFLQWIDIDHITNNCELKDKVWSTLKLTI